MRPPRTRIRTLMIAVAVLAVLIGGATESSRLGHTAGAYRSRSEMHGRMRTAYSAGLAVCRRLAEAKEREAASLRLRVPLSDRDEARARDLDEVGGNWRIHEAATMELIAYHLELERRYWWAARFPWRTVAPDPPEPTRISVLYSGPPPAR